MSGHTSGPWVIYPETDGTEICAVDMVARLPIRQIIARPVVGDNWLANARLIAAAPDLLVELDALLGAVLSGIPKGSDDGYIYDELGSVVAGAVFQARAAIAKATGETP